MVQNLRATIAGLEAEKDELQLKQKSLERNIETLEGAKTVMKTTQRQDVMSVMI